MYENLDSKQMDRPKTAKPSTEDINELRKMIRTLNETINGKRNLVNDLSKRNAETNIKFKVSLRIISKITLSFSSKLSKVMDPNYCKFLPIILTSDIVVYFYLFFWILGSFILIINFTFITIRKNQSV